MTIPAADRGRISACIVNYDGAGYLEAVLEGLRVQGPILGETLLVDNGSRDGGPELVARAFPWVKLIELGENRGPAAARNAGFREARFDRVLFLDNDVVPEAGCARTLDRALDDDARAVAATPRLVYAGPGGEVQCDGASGHFLGLQILHNAGGAPESVCDARPAHSVVSACLLLDRRRWGGQEPFDERFFIFLEDHDFGLRARSAGHDLVAVPSAVCRHLKGTPGLSLRPGAEYPRRRIHFLIRNRWQLLLKNYEIRTLLLASPMLALFEALQLGGVIARGWLPEWAAAARWIVRHRSDIWADRRRVQGRRRRPDGASLEGGPVPLRRELVPGRAAALVSVLFDRVAAGYWAVASRLLRGEAPP